MTTTLDSSHGHPDHREGPPGSATQAPAEPRASTSSAIGFGHRLVHGRPQDPAWVRPALLTLLVATAVLYLWGLSKSGWANSFYSAAVQAGSVSWKAFFFGSSDAGNAITVDKPPMSLWVMELSVRAFGLSSFAILLPQALMGVASVGVLYAAVRRHFSAMAGLLAGAVLALTPVAVLMFRFNNPDALLVLLMIGAAYAVTRAIENGRTRWVVLTGVLIGFGFLTKQLQVFLVMPGFGLAYLLAAPKSLGRRILDLLAGVLAIVVAAGWWLVAVSLTPAADRPFIGGSQHNSIWELTFGYNGFGRLTGNETGSVGGGGGGTGRTGMWGSTGLTRLFSSDMGGQISWLLPAALILLVAGLAITWRAPRTDPTRAALIIWGGWLLVTGLTFSEMQGIIHPYYTVALAPAVGALVGIGGALVWKQRSFWVMPLLGGTVLVTALWSFTLLNRSSDWHPWLKYAVLISGIVVAAALALSGLLARRVVAAVGVAAVLVGLAGPAAYALNTASTGHTGSIVSAGPTVSGGLGGGFPRGGLGGGNRGGFGGGGPGQTPGGTGRTNGTGTGTTNGSPSTQGGFGGGRGGFGGRGGGGLGGLLNGTTPSAALTEALEANASSYTWVAATVGSNNASGYQLATQKPVMAIGGFNGTDPSPTLAQFKADVAAGKIHYFIGTGGLGNSTSSGGSNVAGQIEMWVQAKYTATTIAGTTVYDLTK